MMSTRNVSISVNIASKSNLAETLREIREQTQQAADLAEKSVENLVNNNFSNLERIVKDIQAKKDQFINDFLGKQWNKYQDRVSDVNRQSIELEAKRKFYENPTIGKLTGETGFKNMMNQVAESFDKYTAHVAEGPGRMKAYESREYLEMMKAKMVHDKQAAAEQRMKKLTESRAEHGRTLGTAKFYADEMNQSIPLHWLIGLKASMAATAFGGNSPMLAGTLSSSARLLTGELAGIATPALLDLVKVVNTIRQGIQNMNPQTRTFAENAAKIAMWGSMGAIALKTIFGAVSGTVTTISKARDFLTPLMADGGRMPLMGNWLSRRGLMTAGGIGLAGAALFGYGMQDDSMLGVASRAAGTGMMAGSAARAMGFNTRSSAAIGGAASVGDIIFRMFSYGGGRLPGFMDSNPLAHLDNPENREYRRQIAEILNIENAGGWNTGDRLGPRRAELLQQRILGQFGVSLQDVGLTPENLETRGLGNGRLTQDQIAHIQNLILQRIAGQRPNNFVTPPGTENVPAPVVTGRTLPPGAGAFIAAPQGDGGSNSRRNWTPAQRAFFDSIQQHMQLTGEGRGWFDRFMGNQVTSGEVMGYWRQINPNQQPQHQQQNRRRGLLGALDNISLNFPGSQEVDIGQMHSMLQAQAIRDPAGQRDFEQTQRLNFEFIQRALAEDREDRRGTTQAFMNMIEEFRIVVTRPIGNALGR